MEKIPLGVTSAASIHAFGNLAYNTASALGAEPQSALRALNFRSRCRHFVQGAKLKYSCP